MKESLGFRKIRKPLGLGCRFPLFGFAEKVHTLAAFVKVVIGDGGRVCPMTGAGDAAGGAAVEAPVSARHVDPKTNPPPLAAATENLRDTELLAGGVAVGTSGAAALVPPLLRAFTILRLHSYSVAAFVKVPAVVSTFSRCIALLAAITSRSDSRLRLVRATSGCSSVPCTLSLMARLRS